MLRPQANPPIPADHHCLYRGIFIPATIRFTCCIAFLLAGCSQRNRPPTATIQATLVTANPPLIATEDVPATENPPAATQINHPGTTAQAIYLPEYLPQELQDNFQPPDGYYITNASEGVEFRLDIWSEDANTVQAMTWWTYALAAPFPTIPNQVNSEDIYLAWHGQPSGSFAGLPLLMDEQTLGLFSAWWGAPTEGAVQIAAPEDLVAIAWAQRPAWAILPFESLEPRWKVLSIDGISPLQADFDPTAYALSIPIALSTPPGLFDWSLPVGNRDAARLTIVDMTGVTALVRGTALWMERYGIPYPAQDIGNLLARADITHINNEVPFIQDCPYPELNTPWLISCSPPEYIELLDLVGADVIELTGDHFGDWPPDSMDLTLSIYQEHGMATFGGGLNAEAARQPVLVEHNGNRLAFIGCHIGSDVKTETPEDALATAELPGAALCDFDWLQTEIPALTSLGYQVIFTFQHQEIYAYAPTPRLVADFSLPAQMGATIVSGSQAHQPHGFAFESDAFIHYGLGNLFFDQYHYCTDYACDNAFIDQHVFYAGRHISTELIPIKFIDLARPRLMTSDEAANFLEIIFNASGW